MTNHNRNDPLPEDENLGSAGSPHSTGRALHQRSTEFNDPDQERPPANCEVCNAVIPPTRSRCPDHQLEANNEADLDWTISNIGFAIVEASTKFAALANASVAFRRRNGGVGDNSSYDLVYDFGELSKTLTSNWRTEIPDAAELDTALGAELYQEALEKTDSTPADEGDSKTIAGLEVDTDIIQRTASPNTYLFTEYGTAITEPKQLDQFSRSASNPDHSKWLIPAVLYNSTQSPPNESSKLKDCVNCGTTRHTFEHLVEDDSASTDSEIEIWVCSECGSQKADPAQNNRTAPSPPTERNSDAMGEKAIRKAGEEQFESVMNRLHSDGDDGPASKTEQG